MKAGAYSSRFFDKKRNANLFDLRSTWRREGDLNLDGYTKNPVFLHFLAKKARILMILYYVSPFEFGGEFGGIFNIAPSYLLSEGIHRAILYKLDREAYAVRAPSTFAPPALILRTPALLLRKSSADRKADVLRNNG